LRLDEKNLALFHLMNMRTIRPAKISGKDRGTQPNQNGYHQQKTKNLFPHDFSPYNGSA
jgi:hypothetical protein